MAEKVSEGVRRLSLVLGLLGLIPWGVVLSFFLFGPGNKEMPGMGIYAFLFGPMAFLIPWGVVRVIAWIVAGFMKAQDTDGEISGHPVVPAKPTGPIEPWGKRPCPHCGNEIRNDFRVCPRCDKEVPDLTQ